MSGQYTYLVTSDVPLMAGLGPFGRPMIVPTTEDYGVGLAPETVAAPAGQWSGTITARRMPSGALVSYPIGADHG